MLCLCLSLSAAFAAIPTKTGYQGILRDANGIPITGTVDLVFRIYSSLVQGQPLWEETRTGVAVDGGLLTVELGEIVPLNLAFDQPYFLGITVNGEEMAPRHPLLSAPYAFNARDVDNDSDSLGALLCAEGQVAKRQGGVWTCADDVSSTGIVAQTCADGEFMKGIDANGIIVCEAFANNGNGGAPGAGVPCGQPGCATEVNAACASLGTLAERMVCAHNIVRDGVDPIAASAIPHLTWDLDLAQVAQNYSDLCNSAHNVNRASQYAALGGSGPVGENIAAGSMLTDLGALVNWSAESADYNMEPVGSPIPGGHIVGHYTQVVWANTAKVGCGVTNCAGGITGLNYSGNMIVCNYSPAGNFVGQIPYTPLAE